MREIYALLADGQWHDRASLLDHGAPFVTDEEALAWWARNIAARSKSPRIHDTERAKRIADGARAKVANALDASCRVRQHTERGGPDGTDTTLFRLRGATAPATQNATATGSLPSPPPDPAVTGPRPLPALPPRPAPDPDYRIRGACAHDPNPDRWVDLPPIRIKGKDNPAYDQAVADLSQVCAACPVRSACLWDALAYDVLGVMGGTDEFERADLREQHDLPDPIRFGDAEDPEDARVREQRFTARRLARTGLPNTLIAAQMGVSPMSVSRYLSETGPDTA